MLSVYKLMIGSSKNSRENYPRKYFLTREKETRVKFNPGLSANRLLDNWAQGSYNEITKRMKQDPDLTYFSYSEYVFSILWQLVILGNHCIWFNKESTFNLTILKVMFECSSTSQRSLS